MRKQTLPKLISNRYKLQNEEKLWGQSSSKKGIYLDTTTNKMVFIKIGANQKSQFREFTYQQFFYKQLKKLRNQDIIIPKPLELLKTENYTAQVMEYFPAKSLVRASFKNKMEAYMKVIRFLEKINTMREAKRKSILTKKTAFAQLITLPYFLLKNLIFFFPYASLFFRSTRLIIGFTKKWRRLDSSWVCHGDINVTNVLLYEKKVIILDFACAYLSHRYFDISRVLNSIWYEPGFHKPFWNNIVKEFKFKENERELLKTFVILNLMQRLSQRYENLKQELFYLRRFENILESL